MTAPALREALEESQSLLIAITHERRSNQEIDEQIEMNRVALAAQSELPEPYAFTIVDRSSDNVELVYNDSAGLAEAMSRTGLEAEPLYTAAQLQQAVEQAQAKREPMTREDGLEIYEKFARANALGEVGMRAEFEDWLTKQKDKPLLYEVWVHAYSEGHSEGWNEGYTEGWNEGYYEGLK